MGLAVERSRADRRPCLHVPVHVVLELAEVKHRIDFLHKFVGFTLVPCRGRLIESFPRDSLVRLATRCKLDDRRLVYTEVIVVFAAAGR